MMRIPIRKMLAYANATIMISWSNFSRNASSCLVRGGELLAKSSSAQRERERGVASGIRLACKLPRSMEKKAKSWESPTTKVLSYSHHRSAHFATTNKGGGYWSFHLSLPHSFTLIAFVGFLFLYLFSFSIQWKRKKMLLAISLQTLA
jgi:hypothetical protein